MILKRQDFGGKNIKKMKTALTINWIKNLYVLDSYVNTLLDKLNI